MHRTNQHQHKLELICLNPKFLTKAFGPHFSKTCGALVLVAFALSISHFFELGFEQDVLQAAIRAFFQLTGIGFILKYVFESQQLWTIFLAIFVMMAVAGYTAGKRAQHVPNKYFVTFLSISLSSMLTLVLVVSLRVYTLTPRDFIPISGLVIGNTMSIVGMTLQRLRDEVKAHSGQIEAALALGATPRQAAKAQVRRALGTGLGPSIDYFKTVGIITLPGAMTGMILGGATPLEAVGVQIVILYMLMGATSFAALSTAFVGLSSFFTKDYQLKELENY